VRAPLGVEDEADRLLLLLRRRERRLVVLPRDPGVVPVVRLGRGRHPEHERRRENERRSPCLHRRHESLPQIRSGASKHPCMCSIEPDISARGGRPSARSSAASGWSPRTRSAPPSRMPTPSAPETKRVACSAPSIQLYVTIPTSGRRRAPLRAMVIVSTWLPSM